MIIRVEISPGELFDKITVLLVKTDRISDPEKLKNIATELRALDEARTAAVEPSIQLDELVAELRLVNADLYDVIENIYACEQKREWGDRFVHLAREVYRLNDRRAWTKRKINTLLGSKLVEEKGHAIEK